MRLVRRRDRLAGVRREAHRGRLFGHDVSANLLLGAGFGEPPPVIAEGVRRQYVAHCSLTEEYPRVTLVGAPRQVYRHGLRIQELGAHPRVRLAAGLMPRCVPDPEVRPPLRARQAGAGPVLRSVQESPGHRVLVVEERRAELDGLHGEPGVALVREGVLPSSLVEELVGKLHGLVVLEGVPASGDEGAVLDLRLDGGQGEDGVAAGRGRPQVQEDRGKTV
mmetsp:Transcript_136136/g.422980  ORF Transcript_136136/g.422980 Transcript_136136/m.422980 type:complete len:221 (-) Transcript_136136:721-1383(-)